VAVLELVKYTNKDTVAVLRVLLSKAVKGEIRGVAICYRDSEGLEEALFTGAFKQPGAAAGASLRMSMALMQANGEL
jgi:hypothetical protein